VPLSQVQLQSHHIGQAVSAMLAAQENTFQTQSRGMAPGAKQPQKFLESPHLSLVFGIVIPSTHELSLAEEEGVCLLSKSAVREVTEVLWQE
jgi:hypothetical protein